MFANNFIFYHICQKFGEDGCIWQQDNAQAHGPGLEVIMKRFRCLKWPPHNPDLSPIEMIWSLIKRALKGRVFYSPQELHDATIAAWQQIDQRTIDNLVGSFKAKCRICVKYGGACVNGDWREVHHEHHEADPQRHCLIVPKR
jgi:hypothetical protein